MIFAAQRISAEGHSKVQLQLILHVNNSQVNFQFTGSNPVEDRNKVCKIDHSGHWTFCLLTLTTALRSTVDIKKISSISHEQTAYHQVKLILQEKVARFSQQVNPELEAKTNLLKSDPALYQLYNDLVVGKLITAEEFWANRFGNGSVKGQPLKAGEEQQEIGLPSAFLVSK